MRTKLQPANPAAALANLRWKDATAADKAQAAANMTAGRKKIPKAKRKATARKAAKVRWEKAKKAARKKNPKKLSA